MEGPFNFCIFGVGFHKVWHLHRGHHLTFKALETSVTFWGSVTCLHLSSTVTQSGQLSLPRLEGVNHGCWLQVDRSAAIKTQRDTKSSLQRGATVTTWQQQSVRGHADTPHISLSSSSHCTGQFDATKNTEDQMQVEVQLCFSVPFFLIFVCSKAQTLKGFMLLAAEGGMRRLASIRCRFISTHHHTERAYVAACYRESEIGGEAACCAFSLLPAVLLWSSGRGGGGGEQRRKEWVMLVRLS